jgi:hypothetical protein
MNSWQKKWWKMYSVNGQWRKTRNRVLASRRRCRRSRSRRKRRRRVTREWSLKNRFDGQDTWE